MDKVLACTTWSQPDILIVMAVISLHGFFSRMFCNNFTATLFKSLQNSSAVYQVGLISLQRLDKRTNQAVLILDNHAPFGYHIHPQASTDHNFREEIVVESPYEAIDIFFSRAKEITHEK